MRGGSINVWKQIQATVSGIGPEDERTDTGHVQQALQREVQSDEDGSVQGEGLYGHAVGEGQDDVRVEIRVEASHRPQVAAAGSNALRVPLTRDVRGLGP